MAKMAVCSAGESLDSQLDGRFGRCAYLIIIAEEGNTYEAIPNPAVQHAHGSGTSTAQTLVTKGVQKLVVSRIGPKAFEVLQKSGIKVFRADEGQTVKAAVEKCYQGDLEELLKPNN
jgi:predicted Fe-Mo cluster-binding NifX family protein